MKLSNKFRGGVGTALIAATVIYTLLSIGMFILSYFLYFKIITNTVGTVMLIIEAVWLLPLLLNTYYSLEEEHLFIHQWPAIRKKISYADIFMITDEPEEGVKRIKSVSLRKAPKIYIGYYDYVYNKETKKKDRVKRWIDISPAEMDLFLIKMGGKFKRARDLAAKLEEEHKKQNAEHYRKKAIADKKRAEKALENKPEDVKIAPKKKTDTAVKAEPVKEEKPEAPAEEKPEDEDNN